MNTKTEQIGADKVAKGLYIKDILLKEIKYKTHLNPIFSRQVQEIESEYELNVSHKKRSKKNYLVNLSFGLNVYDKSTKEKVFDILVEVQGDFEFVNFEKEKVNFMIYSFCANTLFPFVRTHIAQTVILSGYKPLLLAPIDFEKLYLSSLKEKQTPEKTTSHNSSATQATGNKKVH